MYAASPATAMPCSIGVPWPGGWELAALGAGHRGEGRRVHCL